MLDPRLLVWVSIFAFAIGYIVWQAVEVNLANKFRQVRKPTNRAFRDLPPITWLVHSTGRLRFLDRCEDGEIFHIGVPDSAIFVAGHEDADGFHILGFDLGTCCVPVHPQCIDCGLQLPASRDLHPRKVRLFVVIM